jgi:hypothetical protein
MLAHMMLVTVPELSLWAEGTADAIDPADPLAIWILTQASALVMGEAGHLDWTPDTPDIGRAKIVVANVAKRCWNNADQELRTAIAGGPSSQVHESAAYGMMLTDAEVAMIDRVVAALPAAADDDGFWILRNTRGPVETRIYVPDDRWPQSSPINYLDPVADPYYAPTSDPALPTFDPATEPTNTVL